MDHDEARQGMVAEKYLLDELSLDLRDDFEEHMFDCPECAFDIRAGAAFLEAAKEQLPELTAAPNSPQKSGLGSAAAARKRKWPDWWRPFFATPAFAAPVFATLLVIVGYQNIVTYPALRAAATEPRLLPPVAFHGATRGGAHTVVDADRRLGVVLLVDVPEQEGYASYAVDLYDPEGKLTWTHTVSAAGSNAAEDGTLSLVIPGAGLRQGSYALAISGVATNASPGQRTEIARHIFDIHFND